jgi:hypothetical protein
MRSLAHVRKRAEATYISQAARADTWVWSEKTVAEWEADVRAFDPLVEDESLTKLRLQGVADAWDRQLQQVQAITRDVVRLGRVRFRKDPVKLALFKPLKTRATSRANKQKEGVAARDAWQQADPAWQPLPDITLTSFTALLDPYESRETAYNEADNLWREAVTRLNAHAERVDDDCIAWYTVATKRFPAGTVEGDVIRSLVPTTARPRRAPGRAVLANVVVTGNRLRLEVSAPRATRFTLWLRAVGEPEFKAVIEKTGERSLTVEPLAPGTYQVKATGHNARGAGPESEVALVTVAGAAAA